MEKLSFDFRVKCKLGQNEEYLINLLTLSQLKRTMNNSHTETEK